MRLTPVAGLALALALAGCGSRGGFSGPEMPQPLPAAPTAPVDAQPLPPPETPVTPETPAVEPAAPAMPDPASAVEIRKPDLSGGWTLAAGGETCQLFMSLTTWAGGYRANARGCTSAELTGISAWNLNGKEIVLLDGAGGTVARLYASSPTRFSGQTTSGRGIQVFRG